jgi:hypothetical protein
MPPQPRQPKRPQDSVPGRGKLCTATRSDGRPCKRQAVVGLTVCVSHGGGTAASVRKSTRAAVSSQVATLWGISPDAGSISIEEELTKLARNKLADVLALRIELSREGSTHIGLMVESREITDSEVGEETYRTVKQKKSSSVSPWVAELHKAEQELVQIMRLLHEVTGGTEEVDVKRIRMQTAREAARLLKAFPGISVDEVAAEVSKRAS